MHFLCKKKKHECSVLFCLNQGYIILVAKGPEQFKVYNAVNSTL